MIRINLLPPEILEKRRAESRRLYLVAIGLAVLAVLGLAWAFMALQVQIKDGEVATAKQQAANFQAQADRFKVFEDRTADLNSRKALADAALAGRINWSKMLTEVALVLPSDMWLTNVDGSQATGAGASGAVQKGAGSNTTSKSTAVMELGGWAILSPAKANQGGFKSIAKLLVRLNDLEQLTNVWLNSAEQSKYENETEIKWDTTADIVVPGSQNTSSAAGVPPSSNP